MPCELKVGMKVKVSARQRKQGLSPFSKLSLDKVYTIIEIDHYEEEDEYFVRIKEIADGENNFYSWRFEPASGRREFIVRKPKNLPE